MKKSALSVSIVLPNWNGEHLLAKHLPAVIVAAHGAEIVVADDASSDGSVVFIERMFPAVTLVRNLRQQGFAGNVNSGVVKAHGDIVVLLNTDVRPEPGFLDPLLARFSDPRVGAAGCLEKSHEAGGVVLRGRGKARWDKGFFIHARGEVDASDTAWVSGGSSAYRKRVWDMFGGMDTLYNPFYWEDIDLSYQIRKSGHSVVFERRSIVHHFHEEGKIQSDFPPGQVKRIAYRNQFIFHWKNISDANIWLSHCLWLPVRLIQAALHGNAAMLRGFGLALGKIPAILKSRGRASRHWKKHDTDLITP